MFTDRCYIAQYTIINTGKDKYTQNNIIYTPGLQSVLYYTYIGDVCTRFNSLGEKNVVKI